MRSKFSCRRDEAFCSRRQGFQRALPRAGDTVVGLVAREGHEDEGSVHLLQHKLQVGHTPLSVRHGWRELQPDCLHGDFSDLFS